MYCILVTGIPAAGKSTMAEVIAEELKLPVISKDTIKELLFDNVGFQSREEKVKLGIASMEIMYYAAGQLMKAGQPFINAGFRGCYDHRRSGRRDYESGAYQIEEG